MKSCISNRKRLACLAAGALEEAAAQELRAHLEACPGCRGYFEELSAVAAKLVVPKTTPEVHATESFHQAWLRKLPARTPVPFWSQLVAPLRTFHLGWRVALPTATVTALVLWIALLSFVHRPALSPTTTPTRSAEVLTKRTLAPTLSNYEQAATRSLDEFDALLTAQAQHPPPAAPVYTVSALISAEAYREN